jgi:flagellar FliL protein
MKEKNQTDPKEKVREEHEERKPESTEPSGEEEQKIIGGMGFLTKILLVVGILVLQITAAYFGMSFLFFRTPAPEKKQEVVEPKFEDVGPIVQLEELVVNPAGSLGRRFLVVKVALELSDAAAQEEISRQMPVINDGLIRLLSSKSVEYLSNITSRDSLREEMRLAINESLRGDNGVSKVFFTGFVLQ